MLDFSSCEDDYPDIAMVHVLINEGKWLTAVSVSLSPIVFDKSFSI